MKNTPSLNIHWTQLIKTWTFRNTMFVEFKWVRYTNIHALLELLFHRLKLISELANFFHLFGRNFVIWLSPHCLSWGRWLWLHVWCQIRKSLSAQLRSSSELLLSNNHKLPQSAGCSSPSFWLADSVSKQPLIGHCCHCGNPRHRLGDLKAIRARAPRWAMARAGTAHISHRQNLSLLRVRHYIIFCKHYM